MSARKCLYVRKVIFCVLIMEMYLFHIYLWVFFTARQQALELAGGAGGTAVPLGRQVNLHQVSPLLWENGEDQYMCVESNWLTKVKDPMFMISWFRMLSEHVIMFPFKNIYKIKAKLNNICGLCYFLPQTLNFFSPIFKFSWNFSHFPSSAPILD